MDDYKIEKRIRAKRRNEDLAFVKSAICAVLNTLPGQPTDLLDSVKRTGLFRVDTEHITSKDWANFTYRTSDEVMHDVPAYETTIRDYINGTCTVPYAPVLHVCLFDKNGHRYATWAFITVAVLAYHMANKIGTEEKLNRHQTDRAGKPIPFRRLPFKALFDKYPHDRFICCPNQQIV